MGIHENRLQIRIDVVGPVEKEQARLGCDRDFHLLRNGKAAAALETLLRKKNLDERPKLTTVLRVEPCGIRNILVDDRAPGFCGRLRPKCLSAGVLREREHGQLLRSM